MRQISQVFFSAVLAAAVGPAYGHAQFLDSRSSDYLLLTDAGDARAMWVNPAGLAALAEASLMAELVLEDVGGIRLSQYTIGFNSRGFAVGYQRDRIDNASSANVLRVGFAVPFTRGTVGAATSWYGVEGPNQRDVDIGVLYGLTSMATIGAAIQHIGRPTVGTIAVPLVLGGGVHVTLAGGRFQLVAQGQAIERRGVGESGFAGAYGGGIRVLLPTGRPIMILGTADFSSNLRIDRLHMGLSVGGRSHLTGIATTARRNDIVEVDAVSLTGVVSNRLGRR